MIGQDEGTLDIVAAGGVVELLGRGVAELNKSFAQ